MDILQLLNSSLRLAAPIILIAIGGLFALKVNIFNLGLEGFTLIGCFSSVVGAFYTNSVIGGLFIGVIATILMTLIYAVFVMELKVNPVICAIAFLTLSSGLTRYLMIPIFDVSGKYILSSDLALRPIAISFLEKVPVIGPIINNQTILVYLSLIIPFFVYIFLYKTNIGLSMRAIGQSSNAAMSAGISVKKVQYFALILNGLFCGLAGAQLALSLNLFNVGMTSGRGFTALAALILTNAEPILTLLVCLLFGFANALANYLSTEGYPSQILAMLPYALALLAAILPMIIKTIAKSMKKAKIKNSKINNWRDINV
ncbi:nucleoside ABC transporter membrane protein [Proteiniborus ethanoligenes]|uniref:Nucleoside ABC transporter membrane protein n=1 Tax=Proteiniborus ethanoligenes TaxID=415015 RepID=A0A1H3LP16_9FIRM|nr:ABC transporter permease [Proteiniborus ethanoligenes]SDY65869.1 nucleoside ABC transporter membrane protein [Proteiniborus ethanoligenes]